MWSADTIDGAHYATFKGAPFGSARSSADDALEYAIRCEARYPGESAAFLASVRNGRQRGGPWRWTLPDGSSGVVQCSRKADAITTLRYEWRRKRLPRGIVWEIAS